MGELDSGHLRVALELVSANNHRISTGYPGVTGQFILPDPIDAQMDGRRVAVTGEK